MVKPGFCNRFRRETRKSFVWQGLRAKEPQAYSVQYAEDAFGFGYWKPNHCPVACASKTQSDEGVTRRSRNSYCKFRVKVKICGITNKDDALAAVESGADGLGFVFYKKSPRYISPKKAREIISELPSGIIKIGVFVHSREKFIKNVAKICSLDMLQFHGSQTPEFCLRFKEYKVIKSFRVKDKICLSMISRYHVFAYLFDSFSFKCLGGTGNTLNWRFLARDLSGVKTPIFLAGGLNEKNVQDAVRIVKPAWVDASSRLEMKLGKKDNCKVKKFIANAKMAGSDKE